MDTQARALPQKDGLHAEFLCGGPPDDALENG
jgi:hypothetical protein